MKSINDLLLKMKRSKKCNRKETDGKGFPPDLYKLLGEFFTDLIFHYFIFPPDGIIMT